MVHVDEPKHQRKSLGGLTVELPLDRDVDEALSR